ncbi:MAG: UDP-N-acetylmuramate dehydrogenase [Spirochaetes bacterium]|nr:UDP-N-acetylmuramate dehydrogenase [Spirochaetota bacterium]
MNIPGPIIERLSLHGAVSQGAELSRYTTYRTGGKADLLMEPRSRDAIPGIIVIAGEGGIPITVIGGGSNLLVGDGGIEGIVMRLCEDGDRRAEISLLPDGTVYAEAMASKECVLSFSVESGLCGIEFMAGIPGCIGGGVMMNAGTTDGSFADIVAGADVVTPEGDARTLVLDRSMFSYRKVDIGEGCIVTGARFRLAAADDPGRVRERINDILADRRMKHPLEYPSAGSVFKNPPGHSSWKLIDDAGLKGKRIGGAAVSELHTNFIINRGGATSRDILELIHFIQETVLARFGVTLQTEIKMLGVF